MKISPLYGLESLCHVAEVNKKYIITFVISFFASVTILLGQNIADKLISVKFNRTPIKEVLKALDKELQYSFVYSDQDIKYVKDVTVDYKSVPLKDVLLGIFGENLSDWKVKNKNQIVLQFDGKSDVSGHIRDNMGRPISFLSVRIKEKKTQTDENGYFLLTGIPIGAQKIQLSYIGQPVQLHTIRVPKNKMLRVNFSFNFTDATLEEVNVIGRTALKKVKELAYNVEVLDAKELHNTSLNISSALDRVSGMRVRQGGGVGSRANFSLNGFSGNHVRMFIDGVPLEVHGNTYQLNNLPIDLADRVEVYKGVSPVSLSSDALGGVVNVVTTDRKMSYLNASYAVGSFNTHKAYISAGANTKNDWVYRTSVVYNYSDNNYWVNAKILDLESSQYLPEMQRVRRFHDKYENVSWVSQIGVVDRVFADRLLLGINLGREKMDDQTGTQMQFVFGERFREATTISPFLTYEKKDIAKTGINARVTANYNFGHFRNIDTASVRYNWLGQSKPKTSPGEFGYSSLKFYDNDGGVTVNLDYALSPHHQFSLSNITTFFNRRGKDPLDFSEESHLLEVDKKNMKNVLGISYQYLFSKNWNTSVFVKKFNQNTSGPQSTGRGSLAGYTIVKKTHQYFGYGLASTYFLDRWQFKTSYENTLRLPMNEEIFGMESFNAGNINLLPERSNNYNVNFVYDASINGNHQMEFGIGALYRHTKDFIIRSIGGTAQAPSTFANHGMVDNKGFNAEAKYYYKKRLNIGANLSYHDLKFKNKYDPGDSGEKVSLSYNTRVPNNPYLFANGFVNLNLSDWIIKKNSLRMGYNTLYVHEFPLHTYEYGQHNIAMIPRQFTHNAFVNYGFHNNRYNITFEAFNITDQDVYDNFSFQKPGRSFTVKLGYAITKDNKL